MHKDGQAKGNGSRNLGSCVGFHIEFALRLVMPQNVSLFQA